jgi:Domain of Unknown Function (DUF349)
MNTNMMNTFEETITLLEELISQELNESTAIKLDEIKSDFDKKCLEIKESVPHEGEETSMLVDQASNIEKCTQLIEILQSKLNQSKNQKASEENQNLLIKREIIENLKKLSDEVNSLGDSFNQFNALKDKWKATGNVPEKHYLNLQRDYRFYNEKFHYNIGLYKESKEVDLKKNLQLKEELLEKLKVVCQKENIKEIDTHVRSLQNEWDEIGPTYNTEWERLRDSFKEYLNTAYQKIQDHHHVVFENMMNNLKLKIALAEKIEAIDLSVLNSPKKWEDTTKEVLAIQEEYKKIGFARKQENEKIWERFRKACNQFFDGKKAYYDTLKEKNLKGKSEKEKLIDQVAKHKDSTDWVYITDAIIKLQQDWKHTASAGHTMDNKLWEIFRGHCDDFFNAKKNYYETLDERQAENLAKKQAVIVKIQEFVSSGDIEKDLAQIDNLKKDWDEIDFVPKKDKEKINALYKDAINSVYSKLNISREELENMRFNTKLEALKNMPNANFEIRNEIQYWRDRQQKLENDISQKENNLAFFSKSKNTSDLLAGVQQEILMEKQTLDVVKDKIKKLRAIIQPS